jgi:hypothetical protein
MLLVRSMARVWVLAFVVPSVGLAIAGRALAKEPALEHHGFVQTSWQTNLTSKQNEFRVDEAQFDIGRQWPGKASFLLRVNYRHVDVIDAQGSLQTLDYNKFIEQAWVSVDLLKKDYGLSFVAGKFALPIGYEAVNIPEMYQYSRSFTNLTSTPNFGTGVMVTFKKSIYDFALYAINGWESLADNNDAKGFGGRIGFSLLKDTLQVGVAYVASPEPIPRRAYSNVRSFRQSLDFDVTYTGIDNLTLLGGVHYSYEDRASQVIPDKRMRWFSVAGTASYKFRPWFAATLRFEHADDPDGARLYLVEPEWAGTPTADALLGTPQTLEALTVALLFDLAKGVRAVVEWRNDWAVRSEDRAVFPASEGGVTKTRRLVAASVFYYW